MIAGQRSNLGDLRKSVRLDFRVKKGDTFTYSLDIYAVNADGEEEAVDLTGYLAQGSVKRKKSDSESLFWFLCNLSGSTLTFSRSGMDEYPAGKYWYDVELKDADGNNVTHLEGSFTIYQDVTQFVSQIYEQFTQGLKSFLKIENAIEYYERHNTLFGSLVRMVVQSHIRLSTAFKSSIGILTTPFYRQGLITHLMSKLEIISALDYRQSLKTTFQGIFEFIINPVQNLGSVFQSQVTIEQISD